MTGINVYVGSDGKIHFKNSAGADSALPFNRGEITTASVVASNIVIGSASNVASASYTATKECYVFAAYAANISEGTLDAQASGGTIITEKESKIGYQTLKMKIIKVSAKATLNMSATIPVQLGGGHVMLGYLVIALG